MDTQQTTSTREIKKDTVVDLPRYLRGPRVGERVGIVQRLLDAEESPLGVASAIIQVMGGYKFNRTMGEPVLIALSEISRKRMQIVRHAFVVCLMRKRQR